MHVRASCAAALDVIVESVTKGNKVSLVGFGTFSSKARPEREARNPKTGEKMIVSAAMVPAFSFGKVRACLRHGPAHIPRHPPTTSDPTLPGLLLRALSTWQSFKDAVKAGPALESGGTSPAS